MQTIPLILAATLLAAAATAQTAPQGPSPLAISVYEEATNTGTKAEMSAPQGVPQGPTPLVTGAYGESTNAAPQTGIAAPGVSQGGSAPLVTGVYEEMTNTAAQAATVTQADQVKAARVSFLMDAGVQYANEGEFLEAEQAYLRALQTDPGNADLFFRLSMLYVQMERFDDAVMLLKKLVEAFPDNPMLQNNLSWIYATGGKMKNGELAVRHAREAILIAPYAPSLWNTLAEAYYVSGQYDKALRSSDCALDLIRRQQGVTKEEISTFEAQHAKIERAAESYKRLLGLDDEK